MTIRSEMPVRSLALVAIVLAAVVMRPEPAAAESAAARPVLRFALISTQSRQETEAKWTPVLNALGRHLGQPVVADVAADYAGAVWGLRSGRDQMAWLGNKSAIEAVDNAGAEVFAQHTYPSGLGGYYTYLLVPKDSALGSADDLIAQAAGLTLAQGDPNSTSGSVVPNYYLFFRRQLEPRKIFKRVIQANHEDNIVAVAEGRVDAATVASLVYDQINRQHPEIINATRIIWRSVLIPADPMVWRKDLAPELKAKISAFFLGYGIAGPGKSAAMLARERAALDRLDVKAFVASDNRQLVSVRLLELARTRMQIEADDSVSAADRTRRLADIDGKIAENERLSSPASN